MTTYFGPVEVRNWLGLEQVLTYPQPSLKLTNGVASWLHFDQLGSVRAITDATGAKVESAIYRPFGEQSEWLLPGTPAPETKGWIGERFDADAGLQYLNARYYDPALGLFLQPDWFEVTKPGVGTNRFSYAHNDPVNRLDPNGNQDAPDMMSVEEQEKLAELCANGCFSDMSYAEQMANVCEAGGCAMVAIAAAPVAAYYAAVAAPATYALGLEIGVVEATGMAVGVGAAAKTAPQVLESIDDMISAGIKVTGKPQVTQGAAGMSHAMASTKAAAAEVNRLGGAEMVDEVIFDTQLGKIVDGVVSRMRPDVTVKLKDGSISMIEAASASQTVQQMRDKIARMGRIIGAVNPGISVSGWSKTVTDILRGL